MVQHTEHRQAPHGKLQKCIAHFEAALSSGDARAASAVLTALLHDDFTTFDISGKAVEGDDAIVATVVNAGRHQPSISDLTLERLGSNAALATYQVTYVDRVTPRVHKALWVLEQNNWLLRYFEATTDDNHQLSYRSDSAIGESTRHPRRSDIWGRLM